MNNFLTLEELYYKNLNQVPEKLKNEAGHFKVFRLEELLLAECKRVPYSRRDYFKISLIKGKSEIHYADKSFEIERNALVFVNPMIPFAWERIDIEQIGMCCVFTEAFFDQYGHIKDYPVFQPSGPAVILLNDEETQRFEAVFLKMFTELESEYTFKYDVLRNLVFDVIHDAQKMQPAVEINSPVSNASERITTLFLELLDHIFSVEFSGQQLKLHTPSAFANQLNIHVNHLNRALREITGKTTSRLIAEKTAQQARYLLQGTDLNISEIAWNLGFENPNHFTAFIKKITGFTPKVLRTSKSV